MGEKHPIGRGALLPGQSEADEVFERADTEDRVVGLVGVMRVPVLEANVQPVGGEGADVVVLVSGLTTAAGSGSVRSSIVPTWPPKTP
ncbi:hypothetical protein AB0C34_28215 [Nocardia sp. NPDC049220]|uniref:hypothetical protein n=1 Tax=Nocardia sp. NPDC049220 TaxID=3155273 RepID=UPI0033FFDF0E